MSARLTVVLASLVLLSCSAPSRMEQGKNESSYFPVFAWGNVPGSFNAEERFRELAECGITLHMVSANPPEEAVKILDVAAKFGIRILVIDQRRWTEPAEVVKSFARHEALFGYHIQDEPTTEDFPKLAKTAAEFRNLDPGHPFYINIFPNFAKKLGTASYDEYVRRFIKEVQPPFLSYDHYPVVATQKEGREGISLRSSFYDNLEQCRRIAQENNLDLWAFCMTMPHYWKGTDIGYPPPTEGHLRLQVYAGLAYGARAIQYFKYWTPKPNPDAKIVYYDGPIDVEGKRTATFDRLKKINGEIKQMAALLLSLRVTATAHADPPACAPAEHAGRLPQGTKGLTPDVPLTALKGDCFVTLATRKDERYLWVVSRSFEREQKATLTLGSGIARLEEVDRGNGEALTLAPTGATRDVAVPLAPGDGRLFKIIGR